MIYRVSAHFKELFKMKILVIVDMQNDFINGALGTPEAQAAVGNVAKKISGFDGDLICITKDTHRSADYLKTQEGQLLPVEHCIKGTHGWRLDDSLRNGKTRSCGCARSQIKHDLTNQAFGFLKVIEPVKNERIKGNETRWKCLCQNCGRTVEVSSYWLRHSDPYGHCKCTRFNKPL